LGLPFINYQKPFPPNRRGRYQLRSQHRSLKIVASGDVVASMPMRARAMIIALGPNVAVNATSRLTMSMLSSGISAISIPAIRTSNPRYANSFSFYAIVDLLISFQGEVIVCDHRDDSHGLVSQPLQM
jgi:hypothetical protein